MRRPPTKRDSRVPAPRQPPRAPSFGQRRRRRRLEQPGEPLVSEIYKVEGPSTIAGDHSSGREARDRAAKGRGSTENDLVQAIAAEARSKTRIGWDSKAFSLSGEPGQQSPASGTGEIPARQRRQTAATRPERAVRTVGAGLATAATSVGAIASMTTLFDGSAVAVAATLTGAGAAGLVASCLVELAQLGQLRSWHVYVAGTFVPGAVLVAVSVVVVLQALSGVAPDPEPVPDPVKPPRLVAEPAVPVGLAPIGFVTGSSVLLTIHENGAFTRLARGGRSALALQMQFPASAAAIQGDVLWTASEGLFRGMSLQTETETNTRLPYKGNHPEQIVVTNDAIYSTNILWNKIDRTDLISGAREPIAIPEGKPTALIAGFGYIWTTVNTGWLVRIDPQDGATKRIRLEATGPVALAADDDWLWMLYMRRGIATPVQPSTNKIFSEREVDVGTGATAFTCGFGSLWVTRAGDERLLRFDAGTGNELGSIRIPGYPSGLAAFDGRIFVASTEAATITPVQPR